jgi:hypothetical protein
MTSLSSKLRELRKILKKNKSNPVFDNEQLIAVARHMPRDDASLARYLSQQQVEAYGDDVLQVTQAHTRRDQAKFEDCILEMGAFVRGGIPGMARLDSVYPNIIRHFGVMSELEEVLEALKLYVHTGEDKTTIKRKSVKDEEEEQQGSQKRARFSQ